MKLNLSLGFTPSMYHSLINAIVVPAYFTLILPGQAIAWGPEGHSIVAEIAQRQLTSETTVLIGKLLPHGASLASIASWADDIRNERPETYNWHFVDIPLSEHGYNAEANCSTSPRGDCVVAEIERAQQAFHCSLNATTRTEALKFLVHFVGDLHQPFHSVADYKGMNQRNVTVKIGGNTCGKKCAPDELISSHDNLHSVWDSTLIRKSVWDWGAYVQHLEDSWLPKADIPNIQKGDAAIWAVETHEVAINIANETPSDNILQDSYFVQMQPILDQQLGKAGLRLAKVLNDPVNCK